MAGKIELFDDYNWQHLHDCAKLWFNSPGSLTLRTGQPRESSLPHQSFDQALLADRLHVGRVFPELLRPASHFRHVQGA